MTRYPEIDLRGASVAITGAGRGIGRATAARLAARGARVAIGDLDVGAAQDAAAAIGGSAHSLDVTDPASCARFLAEAETANGPLGTGSPKPSPAPSGRARPRWPFPAMSARSPPRPR